MLVITSAMIDAVIMTAQPPGYAGVQIVAYPLPFVLTAPALTPAPARFALHGKYLLVEYSVTDLVLPVKS